APIARPRRPSARRRRPSAARRTSSASAEMPRGWWILAAAAIAPRAGHASSALEELAAGTTLATATAPGSRWVSDRLARVWDIGARGQLRLDLSSTRALGDASDTAHDDVSLGALAVAYSPDDHWSLRLSGGGSPEATTRATAAVDAQGLFAGAMGDARLRAAV